MQADIGDFVVFIENHQCRRFASLYSKEVTDKQSKGIQRIKLLLQRPSLKENATEGDRNAGCFLYLCELPDVRLQTVALTKCMELSVLLHAADQRGNPFECSELVMGTRDNLSTDVSEKVLEKIQQYIVDPHSVKHKPYEAKWFSGRKGKSFNEWLLEESKSISERGDDDKKRDEKKNLSSQEWLDAQKKQADQYFKGQNWRDQIDYAYGLSVPVEFPHFGFCLDRVDCMTHIRRIEQCKSKDLL